MEAALQLGAPITPTPCCSLLSQRWAKVSSSRRPPETTKDGGGVGIKGMLSQLERVRALPPP